MSAQHQLAFVSEAEQRTRRSDVLRFFDAHTSQADRETLLRKYHASYAFTPRRAPLDTALVSDDTLRALGAVAHADDRFLLVRVDSPAGR